MLQLIIEEVSHDRFAHFMQQTVFEPLGMARATFDEDLAMSRGIAMSYTGSVPAMHYHFSAPGAASLYSNVTDLARFVMAHLPGEDGAPPRRGVLAPEMLLEMRAPTARMFGADIWGLGTILFVESGASDHVFGHDGENYPAISHAIRVDPVTRSGVIILSSGKDGFATRLAADWVYWKMGKGGNGIDWAPLPWVIGVAVIVALIAAWAIRDTRSRRRLG